MRRPYVLVCVLREGSAAAVHIAAVSDQFHHYLLILPVDRVQNTIVAHP